MIASSIFWLRVAAGLYALGMLHSILVVLRHRQSALCVASGAFRVAVVLHGVAIVDMAMATGRIVENLYQTLSLCAFLIALVFLLVEWRYKFSSTSVALFPLIFVMTLVAAMERPVASWPDQRVRDVWLVVHILLVLAGYAALLLTAVASVAYLIQERRLKTKQSSALLERLPPLATIDNMISGSLGLGFAFITLGVIFGVTWAFIESGTSWIGDADINLSLFTWALLLVMMFLRASAGWRGRKAAVLALTVLGCSAATWVAHTGLGARFTP
jgi:ABC-type uncharacterized transport system permease subunit